MKENNLFKVNTKATDRGDGKTTNFKIKGGIPRNNKVVHIKIDSATIRKQQPNPNKAKPEIHILPTSSITEYDMVKDIITTVGENKGVSIAKKFFKTEDFNDPEFVKLLEALFPYDIVYDEELNDITIGDDGSVTIEGDYANVAAFKSGRYERHRLSRKKGRRVTRRLSKNRVVIGDLLLSHLAGTQWQKKQAFAHLVHEQLHNIIHNNTEFTPDQIYSAAREIYDTFVKAFEKDYAANPNKPEYQYIAKWLSKYNQDIYGEKTDKRLNNIRLEEFIVESLTNNRFISYLNSVIISEENEVKESLFSKILNFIMKYIFGENITFANNSLLAKELNLLANNITPNTEETTESETSSPVEERNDVGIQSDEEYDKQFEEDEDDDYEDFDDTNASSFYDTENTYQPVVKEDDNYTPYSDSDVEVEISSIESFKAGLTIEEQKEIDNMIDNGTLSYICK